MLPPLLCEELCSLNPQVDRLTYSCIWRMNADGTLVEEPAWFGRSVIRSCCNLDYQTAQHMIEGTILPENASSTAPDIWDPSRSEKLCSILHIHTDKPNTQKINAFNSCLLRRSGDALRFTFTRRPTEFTCSEVCEDVLAMNRLAKGRRAKRYQSGALSLGTPKLSFKLDENGNPAEFGSYPIRDSNRLVEV